MTFFTFQRGLIPLLATNSKFQVACLLALLRFGVDVTWHRAARFVYRENDNDGEHAAHGVGPVVGELFCAVSANAALSDTAVRDLFQQWREAEKALIWNLGFTSCSPQSVTEKTLLLIDLKGNHHDEQTKPARQTGAP